MKPAPALALLLLTVAADAQMREDMTVEVVNVPVFVRRDGAPVEGLTRDDFELFVNGKPQPIEYFEVIDLERGAAGSQPAEAAVQRDVRQRRLFLLVFDICFGGPFALLRAQKAAASFLENAGPQDSIGVMVCRKQSGFDLAVPFTTDRPAVRRAIAQLRASDDQDPLRMTITGTERASFLRPPSTAADAEAVSDASGGPASRFGGSGGGSPAAAEGVAAADNTAQPVRREIENLIVGFGEIARNIARLEGQKHIVFMSEGFNLGMLMPEPRLQESMQRMYRSFQAADTFLHTVDTAGLRFSGANASLHMLADGTGGEWVRNRNDLGLALNDLARAHSVEYLLGFTPKSARRGYNTIEVRVKGVGRGADVSHRRGFSTDPPSEAATAIRLSDILLNDIPQTGTAAELGVDERTLYVRVPLEALKAQLREGQAADLYVYVFDANGAGVLSRKSRVTASSKGFKISLDLPPGRYVAKALLVAGESIGFTRLELTLP